MLSNPAQRLHDLLQGMRAVAHSGTIGSAWAKVLDLGPQDTAAALFAALSEVTRLPQQVESALRALPDFDSTLFVDPWKKPVAGAFAQLSMLNSAATTFTSNYGETALLSLRHAAHALRLTGQEAPLEDLPALHAALNDFEAMLLDPGLDPDLANYLLRHVDDMRRAIRLVRIQGPDVLRMSIASTVGEGVLRTVEGKPVPDPASPIGSKLSEVLTQLGAFVGFSNNAIQLGTSVAEGIKALGT